MTDLFPTADVVPGSHVIWVVEPDDDFVAIGRQYLRGAVTSHEKPVYFGPRESASYRALRAEAMIAADPRVDFLGGGPLDPDAMFQMFADQTAVARSEGFQGLRLLADMDWLLPLAPPAGDLVSFELLLDREALSLGATIVCAYRSNSFDTGALGPGCVHPVHVGHAYEPQFRVVADAHGWRLTGEVDLVTADVFRPVITTAVGDGDTVIDVSGLEFIDVAGMRALALAARRSGSVRVVGARAGIRRCWSAAAFDQAAPNVEFVPDVA